MSTERSRPIRVLIVDDHRCILWGLEKLIQSGKPVMEVVGSATNCAEALALMDKAAPDIILLDLDLGTESGLDAISLFRARSPAKILVLTALQDKWVHGQAVLAGAHGVVETVAPVDAILTAIVKVDQGQIWLDRATIGRILGEFSSQDPAQEADPEWQKISSLTDREREIIAVMSNHADVPASGVAEKLHISEHTLRNHLTAIYYKLRVTSRLGLFAYAQNHGLDKFPV
jgi:DNA-binding NarL/FixJ family response regulator